MKEQCGSKFSACVEWKKLVDEAKNDDDEESEDLGEGDDGDIWVSEPDAKSD